MSLITKRLKLFIDKKGLKVTNLEKQIGLPNSTLSRPFKEGKGIKTENLEKVLEVLTSINPVWLVTGTGNMEKRDPKEEVNNEGETKSLTDIISNFMSFPSSQQVEIKQIIAFYLERVIKEVKEVTANQEELENDIEDYKNDLKNIQALAQSRQENKVLKKENEVLKEQVKMLRSSN